MEPVDYYTWDIIRARKVNEPPRYLFLFTTAADAWLHLHPDRPDINELQNSEFGLRTTENPQTHGPCVFVLDSECLLDLGFTLYPFDDGAIPRSAIWRVIDADKKTEFIGDPLHPHVIYNRRSEPRSIPFACVATVRIYLEDSNLTGKNAFAVRKAALVHGFEVQSFKWEEWWTDDGPIRRTADA